MNSYPLPPVALLPGGVSFFRAMGRRLGVFMVVAALGWPGGVWAHETDQFLWWDQELVDGAPALNRYLNDETAKFLASYEGEDCECGEVTQDIFHYFFEGLLASKLKDWIRDSGEVPLYPDKSVSSWDYQQSSIFRGLAFPYYLPMARTLRIGDVHLGIDKIGHFLGFGRRYYRKYLRLRELGIVEDEAVERVMHFGLLYEKSVVGTWVDGVFSYADLEANYQGFRLARSFCEGEAPLLAKREGRWVLAGEIDLRPYITPDFDESYNLSHYWLLRKIHVERALEAYEEAVHSPVVQARFARYRQHEPSLAMRYTEAYFAERGRAPRNHPPLQELGVRGRDLGEALLDEMGRVELLP